MQHHRQVHIDALHREAAAAIARMYDAAPGRILIGGVTEAAANLERQLPKRIASIRLENHVELQASVERALDEVERGESEEALARVKTLALSGGRGVLGIPSVIDALNQSRPMRLFLPEICDGTILICDQCRSLSQEQGNCRICGGTTRAVDTCEGLMRAARQLGARIDILDRAILESVGGAAAELRY